jgi:hypothetical protein
MSMFDVCKHVSNVLHKYIGIIIIIIMKED